MKTNVATELPTILSKDSHNQKQQASHCMGRLMAKKQDHPRVGKQFKIHSNSSTAPHSQGENKQWIPANVASGRQWNGCYYFSNSWKKIEIKITLQFSTNNGQQQVVYKTIKLVWKVRQIHEISMIESWNENIDRVIGTYEWSETCMKARWPNTTRKNRNNQEKSAWFSNSCEVKNIKKSEVLE